MEKTCTSATVTKHNSPASNMLRCGTSDTEKERGSHDAETDVMVERVSSTSEQNLQKTREKLMDLATRSLPHTKARSEKHRYAQKSVYSRSRSRDGFTSKFNKSSHSSRFYDKTHKRQGQRMPSQPHVAGENRQVESEVSSSSLVLASRRSSSLNKSYGTGSPTKARKRFNFSKSKTSVQSYRQINTHPQHLSSDLDSLIESARAATGNYKQDMEKHKSSRQCKEMTEKDGSRKVYHRSSEDKNVESSTYKEMIERKVKEIRDNLERMSNKSLDDSVSQCRKIDDQELEEQDSQIAPIPLSRRCCSPPPKPTNTTKYWSDASETEDESDLEKHHMHVNSVNIVLNFLKKNTNEYYVEGKKGSNCYTDQTKQSEIQPKSQSKCFRRYRKNKNYDRSLSPPEQSYPSSTRWRSRSPPREHQGRYSRPRSPVFGRVSGQRDQWSRSPSQHREFHHRRPLHSPQPSHSPHRERQYYSRSRSPPGYQGSCIRRRGSHSPAWRDQHRRRDWSPPYGSFRREDRSRSPSSPHRSVQRDSRLHSPWRQERRSLRDSPPHLSHSESPPPYYSDGFVRSGSTHYGWDTGNSPVNRSPNESPYRRLCSPKGSYYSEDFDPREGQSSDYMDHGACGLADWYHHNTDSREQYFSHGPSPRNQDSGMLKEEHFSTMNRGGRGFSPSSQCLPPLRPDQESPSHGRHAYGHKSPRSRSFKPHTSVMDEESNLKRRKSRPKKKVSQKLLQHKYENEIKLPQAFGKGARKSLRLLSNLEINTPSLTGGNFFREDTDNQDKRTEYEGKGQGHKQGKHFDKGSTLNSITGEDIYSPNLVDVEDRLTTKNNAITLDDDDDEPIIDRPEDYLNAPSTLPTNHRPSFVPDVFGRQKLELLQSQEDLTVTEPSGITDVISPEGQKIDDLPCWQRDSTCHQETEDRDSAVPPVRPPSLSQAKSITSEETSPDMLTLSSSLKDITKTVTKKDEEALSTLNSAEMNALVTLIKLAKDHVATGKSLPTNMSQLLKTVDTNTTKMSETQGSYSGNKQQQQPSTSHFSAGVQDLSGSEASTSNSNINDKENIDDGQNIQHEASMTNVGDCALPKSKKDSFVLKRKTDDNTSEFNTNNCTIPKDKREEFALKRKTDDNPSKPKYDKLSQNENKTQGSKSDDKFSRGKMNDEPSLRKTGEKISKEKWKEKMQLSPRGGDMREEHSKKKVAQDKSEKDSKKVHKDKAEKLNKDEPIKIHKDEVKKAHKGKGESQKVCKNVSKKVCNDKNETNVALKVKSKKVSKDESRVLHRDEGKKQLKSSAESISVAKTFKHIQSVRVHLSAHEVIASRGKSYRVQGTKILRMPKKRRLKQVGKRIFMNDSSDSDSDSFLSPEPQVTTALNHPVIPCSVCKHGLNADEFTTVHLNTGTVTMRCRNCLTFARMEKVVSLNTFTAKLRTSASKLTGEAADNEAGNVMAPSKHRQNEDVSQKQRSLGSNKQTEKYKTSSQNMKNAVKGKIKPSSCKERTAKKVQGMNEENKLATESSSTDPHLYVFPWKSSRKRKPIHSDLIFIDDSSDDSADSDDCSEKQKERSRKRKTVYTNLKFSDDSADSDDCSEEQDRQQLKKIRKDDSSTTRRQNEVTAQTSTPAAVKSGTASEGVTAMKSSDDIRVGTKMNPGRMNCVSDVPESGLTPSPPAPATATPSPPAPVTATPSPAAPVTATPSPPAPVTATPSPQPTTDQTE